MSVLFSFDIDSDKIKVRKKLAPKERTFRSDGKLRSASPVQK